MSDIEEILSTEKRQKSICYDECFCNFLLNPSAYGRMLLLGVIGLHIS